MKPPRFRYERPETLAQALVLLKTGNGDARAIAGGQSLGPMLNLRLSAPDLLVDLGNIPGLRGIRIAENGDLFAGAMTRHSDFEFSEAVRANFPLLHAAMPGIAHMPIRSRGTIGGSLAHSDPSGDWPALCVACSAELQLKTTHGERIVAAENFSRGMFSTALADGELITQIRFPAWPSDRRWGLQKMTRRRGDFAIVGVVCTVDRTRQARVSKARIVVFGASESPIVLQSAADNLIGHIISDERILETAVTAALATPVRSDLHADADYRRQLVQTLTRRALEQAVAEPPR